ncbi:hypothetical protein LOAG_19020 [Loa loa]|uniref:Uncharacterized protein n=1 Tax=Loa loa TaxID=7209 RepID=A0A1S0UDD5_LOALO|nr:hypothetical protein LOAG_19020 [Loa loa]EJD73563.1 hypothetical protein LOAG_19020 [Loa loa]
MLLQRDDVIAKREKGILWIAPCKTDRVPLPTIEFTGGLINKFEIEKINAESKLLSYHYDTTTSISSHQRGDSIWEEIAEQGESTNRIEKEFDQVIQSIQEELESVATNGKF